MRRTEIWMINLSPTLGAEIHKIRPAVIVNDDNIGIRFVRCLESLSLEIMVRIENALRTVRKLLP